MHFLIPVAHAATSIVGGYSSSGGGGGFLGISWGNGAHCFGGSICSVAQTILYLINSVAVPVLFAVAFIVFIYGIVKYFFINVGDEESRKNGRLLIFWGIIGFVIIISLWGLVNVIAATFGLAGFAAPPPPTSY